MSEFELLDTAGDISGKLRLIYGSGPADPTPFVLTVTAQYVARALGKTCSMACPAKVLAIELEGMTLRA